MVNPTTTQPSSGIIVSVDDRYKKCDSWSPFLNTLYLYFGIPFLVTLTLVIVLLLIYLITYLVDNNTTMDSVLNTPVMTVVVFLFSIIPIILTYNHVISIKKDCYNSGKSSGINELPIATPVATPSS
jgi:hypothetical protein